MAEDIYGQKMMVEIDPRAARTDCGHGLITIRPGVPLATARYASWLSSRS
jgi:hypothetical protein